MARPRSVFLLLVLLPLVTACGVKRPLIAPKDIPAHEAKRQKKMERYHTDDTSDSDEDSSESEGQ